MWLPWPCACRSACVFRRVVRKALMISPFGVFRRSAGPETRHARFHLAAPHDGGRAASNLRHHEPGGPFRRWAIPRVKILSRPAKRTLPISTGNWRCSTAIHAARCRPWFSLASYRQRRSRRQTIVLDVGCGSGYSAAVLSRIAGTVVALEEDAALAEAAGEARNGRKRVGDAGIPGSWRAEPCTVRCDRREGSIEIEPTELLAQLRSGGACRGLGCGPGGEGQCLAQIRRGRGSPCRVRCGSASAWQLAKKAEFAF